MEPMTPLGDNEYLSDNQSDSEYSSSSNSQCFIVMFVIILLNSSASQEFLKNSLYLKRLSCIQVACLASQALAHQSLAVVNQTQSSPILWFQVSTQKHSLLVRFFAFHSLSSDNELWEISLTINCYVNRGTHQIRERRVSAEATTRATS